MVLCPVLQKCFRIHFDEFSLCYATIIPIKATMALLVNFFRQISFIYMNELKKNF